MEFETFEIEGPLLIKPLKIGDARGWFAETFRLDRFAEIAGAPTFVQHNRSMSAAKGTVRGLHFQIEPRAQGKLVSCPRGGILDVAIDLRRSSPTFGRYLSAELTEENSRLLWIPPGFGHGFVTRGDHSEVFYLVTDYYSPTHDRGLLWNDPAIEIDWGVTEAEATLSDKDKNWPGLRNLPETFA